MNFRSVAQLGDEVLTWSKQLPRDIEVVVGVPRSGMLAAVLLALYRDLPVADVDGLIAGRCLDWGSHGDTTLGERDAVSPDDILSTPRRVLVVDDSLSSGAVLRGVRERIQAAGLPHDVTYGAVYVQPGATSEVDHYGELLAHPRLFEWNAFRHPVLASCCIDMDGVLCPDPLDSENDDGDAYARFLAAAPPLLRPAHEVGWIVTSRIERDRAPTERWLAEQGIAYRELVMLDYPDGGTRRRMGTHSAFKADVYRTTGAELFFESSTQQAIEIASLARKDVLAVDSMHLVRPGLRSLVHVAAIPRPRSTARKRLRAAVPPPVRRQLRRTLRRPVGRGGRRALAGRTWS